MRGYFSIGSERISKPMNLGALMRTANAFGASYVFSIEAGHRLRDAYQADTSKSAGQIPYYQWDSIDEMQMPRGCQLVAGAADPESTGQSTPFLIMVPYEFFGGIIQCQVRLTGR